METDKTEEVIVDTETNKGEGEETNDDGFVKVPKADYDKMNQTLGSMKRELKDLKKPKEETKETPEQNHPDNTLLQKAFLRSAQITDKEEVELALSTAKKWGLTVDDLVDDVDWQAKLDKFRTTKSNAVATSKVRGGQGSSEAKNTPEYWIAKGVPRSREDVPDRATRVKIAKAFMESGKNTKKFYNDK